MEKKYSMEFSYRELDALKECLQFTDMMGDVECYDILERIENKLADINLNLNTQKNHEE